MIMTSQILFRVPTELKKKFKQTTKEQWVSMDYVLNLFIRAYIEDSSIVKVGIDMEKLVEVTKKIQ
jgi:antitoxin component of RelBE/YafQ-DinJ toxin-antitoxin module